MPAPASRSVAGIALKEGRFFVARRLPGGPQGGKWEFPGGKVEAGESDAEALVREYREEFGVEARVGEKLAQATFEHGGRVYVLSALRVGIDEARLRLIEHSAWRWASLEEIASLDFVESDAKLLNDLERLASPS